MSIKVIGHQPMSRADIGMHSALARERAGRRFLTSSLRDDWLRYGRMPSKSAARRRYLRRFAVVCGGGVRDPLTARQSRLFDQVYRSVNRRYGHLRNLGS